MEKIITTILLIMFVQIGFSQNLATIELQKTGSKDEWKWVTINNHKKAVILEIRKEATDCNGKTTTEVMTRTAYSTIGKKPIFFDDYGYKCASNRYRKKIYTVIKSKFKE